MAAVVAPPAAVQVSGATGSYSAHINGVYRPVAGEGVGGRPVYQKNLPCPVDIRIEYLPGRGQWVLTNRFLSNNNACMYSLGSQKEAWVVEEVTAGWGVYDSTTKVWSVLTGVRVVRYAEEPARRVLQGAETSNLARTLHSGD